MKMVLFTVEDLELEVELELTVEEVLAEMRVGGADGQVEVGHGDAELLGVEGIGEDVGVEADGVLLELSHNREGGGLEDEGLGVGSGLVLHGKLGMF